MPDIAKTRKDCDELVERMHPVLFLIAHRYLEIADANDAVQETITRFIGKCLNGNTFKKPEAFMYGILRNVIKEQGSQNRKKIAVAEPDPIDPDPTLDEIISQADSCDRIDQAFKKLPIIWQELLWSHFVDKKSFSELEHTQGIPHSTLHRQMKKYLKQFARELKKVGINGS